MKKLLLATALVVALAVPAKANNFDLIKGDITHDNSGWPEQLLTLKNNTKEIVTVSVECGFLKGNTLVGVDAAAFVDVPPNGNGYSHVSNDKGDSDRTDCRITGVYHGEDYQ
jgi:hypothetical protein